ncbi:MAG TPA: hypothetical protein VGS10_07365 [Terracidiphilus sp.]|nr:hypothetical protein [Terracidiphilus sp.]
MNNMLTAFVVIAKETAHMQFNGDRNALPRQIAQLSLVPAMRAARETLAGRTTASLRSRPQHHNEPVSAANLQSI